MVCCGVPPIRIIPARAGFTGGCVSHEWILPDHPRSRGVYARCPACDTQWEGSSPLARGLQPALRDDRRPQRIIPARAGFTLRRLDRRVGGGDHPRSRGVYPHVADAVAGAQGSSPLARGLLKAVADLTTTIEDHPRSRGVYRTPRSSISLAWGSSPLARGLLFRREDIEELLGIIPARAGFTLQTSKTARSTADHPRSRGVYCDHEIKMTAAPGSSPLARGLRREGRRGRHGCRIIPARAGFTRPKQSGRLLYADHPRSRGVYTSPSMTMTPTTGSSPLARGLHRSWPSRSHRRRIIPARAGFTPPRSWWR